MMCTAILSTVTHAAHEQEKLSLSSFWVVGWWQKYICVCGDTINLPCLFLLLQVCESGFLVIFWNMGVCGLSDIHRKCVFRYQLHLLCYGDASSFKVGWLVNTYARPPPFPHLNQSNSPTLKVTNMPQEALTFKGNEPIQKANLTCYTLLHFSGLHVSPCFHAKKRKSANSIHSMVSNKEEREKDLQIAQILDQPDHKGCWNLAPRNKSTIKEKATCWVMGRKFPLEAISL